MIYLVPSGHTADKAQSGSHLSASELDINIGCSNRCCLPTQMTDVGPSKQSILSAPALGGAAPQEQQRSSSCNVLSDTCSAILRMTRLSLSEQAFAYTENRTWFRKLLSQSEEIRRYGDRTSFEQNAVQVFTNSVTHIQSYKSLRHKAKDRPRVRQQTSTTGEHAALR